MEMDWNSDGPDTPSSSDAEDEDESESEDELMSDGEESEEVEETESETSQSDSEDATGFCPCPKSEDFLIHIPSTEVDFAEAIAAPWQVLPQLGDLPTSSTVSTEATPLPGFLQLWDCQRELVWEVDDLLRALEGEDPTRLTEVQHAMVPTRFEECVRSCGRSYLGIVNVGLHLHRIINEEEEEVPCLWSPGKRFNNKGIPDFVAKFGETIVAVAEVKLKNNIKGLTFDSQRNRAVCRGKTRSAFEQVYGYMINRNVKYGILTTYQTTFFLRIVNGDLQCSTGFFWHGEGDDSVTKLILGLTLLAKKSAA